ncbi:hypothetical protein [Absidia glauca]|uniref:Uncharacterized protein n=1 Tax=Absidia glauca TaxID=4829 RepID=A0A163K6D1_ABSGL|nr:hypothetical protein [Absidia glauca]
MSAAGLPLAWSQTITSPSFGALSELAVFPAMSAVRVGEVGYLIWDYVYGDADGLYPHPDRITRLTHPSMLSPASDNLISFSPSPSHDLTTDFNNIKIEIITNSEESETTYSPAPSSPCPSPTNEVSFEQAREPCEEVNEQQHHWIPVPNILDDATQADFEYYCRIRQNKKSVINVLCVIEAKEEKEKKK